MRFGECSKCGSMQTGITNDIWYEDEGKVWLHFECFKCGFKFVEELYTHKPTKEKTK